MFFAPVRHQGGAVGQDKRTTMTMSVTQEQMWKNVFHHTLTVPLSQGIGNNLFVSVNKPYSRNPITIKIMGVNIIEKEMLRARFPISSPKRSITGGFSFLG